MAAWVVASHLPGGRPIEIARADEGLLNLGDPLRCNGLLTAHTAGLARTSWTCAFAFGRWWAHGAREMRMLVA